MLIALTSALAAPLAPNQVALHQTGRETTLEYSWVKRGVGFSFGLRNSFTGGRIGTEGTFAPVAKVGVVFERRLSDHWSLRTGVATAGPSYTAAVLLPLAVTGGEAGVLVAATEVPALVSYQRGNLVVSAGLRTQPFALVDSIERGATLENIGPTVGLAWRF
ncbi:MAG: hypothetical protein H6737_30910 [Alphaproteobacteria bacterium]|nr:hypothetical protein [Alphaproteobacteria bacterium]